MVKASLPHRPLTFMTSKGTPRSRYSRVERVQSCADSGLGDLFEEFGFGEGAVHFLELVCKNVGIEGRVVDEEVVVERGFGICGPKLFAP